MAKKKVVKIPNKKVAKAKKPLTPTVARPLGTNTVVTTSHTPLIFDKTNYIYFAIGTALIIIGLALMTGGSQPDPNEWDPNIIYSTRITLIAPMVILAGLIMGIVGIFKK